MKFIKTIWNGWRFLVLGALVFLGAGTSVADTNSVRLAIGPFFAPAGNPKLDEAAAAFPDLLAVALSRDNRFQLVERDKANAVWSELHLTEAGLTSAATVARLGNILSCDWLISGLLVPSETGPQIWVKVIDTQSGVVLDLQSLPYNVTNFSATAGDIAQFLAQARKRKQPREFIALERFQDTSVGTTREDWTPRLSSLIEKYFLSAGYGVVERGTVAPIFAEYQFQSAGMTGDATRRVKLQPAFWIVSGSWKWLYDKQDILGVTINVQKMGGGVQLINFRKPPGPELARSLVEAIQSALKATGSLSVEQAQAGEEKFLAEHTQELLKGRGETWTPPRFAANTPTSSVTVTNASGDQRRITIDSNWLAQQDSHKQEMFKSLQQSILLNPKDMRAKYLLGMALFGAPGEGNAQGEELLGEVAKSGDPVYASKAKNWLDDVRTGKISFKHDQFGNLQLETRGQPASMPNASVSAQRMAAHNAWVASVTEITNIAAKAENCVQMASPPAIAYYKGGITAYTLGKGKLYLACGMTLKSFDWSGTFGIGSGTDFEDVKLPPEVKNGIRAMETDDEDLWFGTEGGGLIRVPQSGGAPRVYNEKDGFPMSSIKSLRLESGRLLIGFGDNKSGSFGYLDMSTGKFTGMPNVTPIKSREDRLLPPPRSPVVQIKTEADHNMIWVSSDLALYRLKLDTKQWSLALPARSSLSAWGPGLRTLSVGGGFVATIVPTRCVAFSQLPGNQWTCVNISTNFDDNYAYSLVVDGSNPGKPLLWIGSGGRITVLDLKTSEIVGECKLASPGNIDLIICYSSDVFFLGGDPTTLGYCLYHLAKPKF